MNWDVARATRHLKEIVSPKWRAVFQKSGVLLSVSQIKITWCCHRWALFLLFTIHSSDCRVYSLSEYFRIKVCFFFFSFCRSGAKSHIYFLLLLSCAIKPDAELFVLVILVFLQKLLVTLYFDSLLAIYKLSVDIQLYVNSVSVRAAMNNRSIENY